MAENKTNDPAGSNAPSNKKTAKVKKRPARKKTATTVTAATALPDSPPSDTVSERVAADTGGRTVVVWAALALSVVALGVGGYSWYLGAVDSKLDAGQQQIRLERIEQRIAGFEQAQTDIGVGVAGIRGGVADIGAVVDQLEGSLAGFQASTDERIRDIDNQISEQNDGLRQDMQTQIDAVSNQVVALGSNFDSNLDQWIVAEAGQLVVIADQRLRFAGEAGLAKRALQLADQQLAQLPGAAASEVRQLLSADIAALENMPSIDVPGVLKQLSALSEQVAALPLAGDIVIDAATANADASQEQGDTPQADDAPGAQGDVQGDIAESSTFSGYLQPVVDAGASLLTSLGDLIQVEKNDSPVKPLVSAEVRRMTYENTRLILASAQLALIQGKPDLCRNRIDAAGEWVEHNFKADTAATRDWLGRLDQVGSALAEVGTVDISATLSAVRALADSGSASPEQ